MKYKVHTLVMRHSLCTQLLVITDLMIIDGTCIDKDAGLKVLSVIVSNETIHEQNIAFSCNMKLLVFRQHLPSLPSCYTTFTKPQESLFLA